MHNQLSLPIISSLLLHIPHHLDIINSLCMAKVMEHLNLEMLILDMVVALLQEAGVNRFQGMVHLKVTDLPTQVHPLKVITLQDD